jgi:hypothetical protein
MTLYFQSKASLVFLSVVVPTDCIILNYIPNHIHVCKTFALDYFSWTECAESYFTSACNRAEHDWCLALQFYVFFVVTKVIDVN